MEILHYGRYPHKKRPLQRYIHDPGWGGEGILMGFYTMNTTYQKGQQEDNSMNADKAVNGSSYYVYIRGGYDDK